eukprot:6213073-Pyramimonas_sp.AAC.1
MAQRPWATVHGLQPRCIGSRAAPNDLATAFSGAAFVMRPNAQSSARAATGARAPASSLQLH